MLNLNHDRLAAVAQAAFDACSGKKDERRWQNAIVRALQILRDSIYWHMTETGVLILLSPDSSEIYETDGRECHRVDGERRVPCRAYELGQPCKHRSCHRLLVRYQQAQTSH